MVCSADSGHVCSTWLQDCSDSRDASCWNHDAHWYACICIQHEALHMLHYTSFAHVLVKGGKHVIDLQSANAHCMLELAIW